MTSEILRLLIRLKIPIMVPTEHDWCLRRREGIYGDFPGRFWFKGIRCLNPMLWLVLSDTGHENSRRTIVVTVPGNPSVPFRSTRVNETECGEAFVTVQTRRS